MLRRATADDGPFLEEMLAAAADWRPGTAIRTAREVLAQPELAHYVAGWPRERDAGVIAEVAKRPVGAAWWRIFSEDDPGFGFVDSTIPELAIGVNAEHRGRGIGTRLLTGLIEEATERNLSALSLSVEPDNPAARLYRRVGFQEVRTLGGSLTMVLEL